MSRKYDTGVSPQPDLMAAAVSHLADGVVITDGELKAPGPRIVFVNEAMSRISGYSTDELIGKTPRILQGELTDRTALDGLKRDLAQGLSHACELINYRKDGTLYHAQLFVAPLCDANGRCTNFVATHRDVSERHRSAETLRDRDERMRAILNTAVDAIVTIDERGIIDNVNPATERMFGYSRDELIGRNVSLLMPAPYRDEHDDYLRRYLETGEAKIIGIGREVEGRRKDGSVFPIDLAVSRVEQLGLFTGIIRDITDRKAEHERLIQSERLAALGEAMTGLTHESRNALARGQGNLRRLARRLKGSDELLELIDGALRANDDIRRQFEEVRQYAAPLQLHREAIRIADVIEEVWDSLSGECEGRDVNLAVEAPPDDHICHADRFLVGNAFRNILENSLAACSDRVEIDIHFSETMIEDLPAVEIRIRDNGPGMPPEVQERAFDAFYTTKTRGTGLGLAIVRRTIEAHGGQVVLGTGPGGGTETTITLPWSGGVA